MALWLQQNSCLVWEAKRETKHLQSQWQNGEVIDLAADDAVDPGDILRPRAVEIQSH
jgi:hypothetical protein